MKDQDNIQNTTVNLIWIYRETEIYLNSWTKFPLHNRQPPKALTFNRQPSKLEKITANRSRRKQPTFGDATTGFPAKWCLGNEHRNSILTNQKHYPDLGSDASSIWNFCARFDSQMSFDGETSGTVDKCRLFSQATSTVKATTPWRPL